MAGQMEHGAVNQEYFFSALHDEGMVLLFGFVAFADDLEIKT